MASRFPYLVALAVLITNGFSEIARSQEIQIVDYGVYQGRVVEMWNDTNAPTGRVRAIQVDLVRPTDIVPAILNTKFGFKFKVVGTSGKQTVRLRFQTTFPEMTNPATGTVSSSYEVSGDVPVGPDIQGMYWDFLKPWEMRPGKWTMRIYSGDRLLAGKIFTVVEAKSSSGGKLQESVVGDRFVGVPRDEAHACSKAVGELVQLGLKAKYDLERPQVLPSIHGPPTSPPGQEYLIAFPLAGAKASADGALLCHCFVKIYEGHLSLTEFPTKEHTALRVLLDGNRVRGYERTE